MRNILRVSQRSSKLNWLDFKHTKFQSFWWVIWIIVGMYTGRTGWSWGGSRFKNWEARPRLREWCQSKYNSRKKRPKVAKRMAKLKRRRMKRSVQIKGRSSKGKTQWMWCKQKTKQNCRSQRTTSWSITLSNLKFPQIWIWRSQNGRR